MSASAVLGVAALLAELPALLLPGLLLLGVVLPGVVGSGGRAPRGDRAGSVEFF
ncbi:MAG: hypothetical protein ACKO65_11575 [Betaproteobacteria bacterium]